MIEKLKKILNSYKGPILSVLIGTALASIGGLIAFFPDQALGKTFFGLNPGLISALFILGAIVIMICAGFWGIFIKTKNETKEPTKKEVVIIWLIILAFFIGSTWMVSNSTVYSMHHIMDGRTYLVNSENLSDIYPTYDFCNVSEWNQSKDRQNVSWGRTNTICIKES